MQQDNEAHKNDPMGNFLHAVITIAFICVILGSVYIIGRSIMELT